MRWFLVAMALFVSAATVQAAGKPPVLNIKVTPVDVVHRTYDPKHIPPDMPPQTPPEIAVCVGDFLANANVGAQAQMTSATTCTATINHIDVTLNLDITIWVPEGADKTVIDHEEGHRQISEYFYKNAETIARQVATPYLGKEYPLTGNTNTLQKKLNKLVNTVSKDIAKSYNAKMIVEPTQDRYDKITDHSRNNVPVKDAIAQAIRETTSSATRPATQPAD